MDFRDTEQINLIIEDNNYKENKENNLMFEVRMNPENFALAYDVYEWYKGTSTERSEVQNGDSDTFKRENVRIEMYRFVKNLLAGSDAKVEYDGDREILKVTK